MILYLLLVFLLCFYTVAVAKQSVQWPDNNGFDPATGKGWLIDVGTLEGWQGSNFDTLEYKASGKSEVVGNGVTVEGIKVNWQYPLGNIGKGEADYKLNQSIDYTVVAVAKLSSLLKLNIFGNGGGNGSNVKFFPRYGENDIPRENNHLMVFSPSLGGIVNTNWEFTEIDAVDYATGEAPNLYIHACDLWSANIWSNVPYGFAVSSTGLGDFAGLDKLIYIEMRYLERVEAGIVTSKFGLPFDFDNYSDEHSWSDDYVLDEKGVEIGQYSAGQNAHINMQFRIPVTGAPAGRYKGEVTFSIYTI